MPVYTYIASQDYVNPHPTELVGLSPIIDRLFAPKINEMHLGKVQAKEGKSVGHEHDTRQFNNFVCEFVRTTLEWFLWSWQEKAEYVWIKFTSTFYNGANFYFW